MPKVVGNTRGAGGAVREYDVRNYGAVGDGVANDAPAISAALTAAPSGSVVYLPLGTYKLDSVITTPTTGVTIKGSGPGTVIKNGALASGNVMVNLTKSDTAISDLTLDANNVTNVRMLWLGAVSTKRYRVERVHFRNGVSYGIRGGDLLDDVQIRDCRFYDMLGVGVAALSLQGSTGSRDITIAGCSFRNIGDATTDGALAIQVFGTVQDVYTGVKIQGNHFDILSGTAPIEPTGCTDIVISDNVISSAGRRGITTGNLKRFTVSGNIIYNNTIYFLELNGLAQYGTVSGNVSVDNEAFIRGTGTGIEDLTVSGNTVIGGFPSASGGIIDHVAVGGYMKRVLIEANTFRDALDTSGDATPSRSVIRTTAATGSHDIVIRNNTWYATHADAITRFVHARSATRVQISGNRCIVTRNIPSGYTGQVIGIGVGTSGSGLLIEGNYINCTGTNAASNWNAIAQQSAGAYDGVHVHRNLVEGNFNNEVLTSGITGTPAVNAHDNE